MGKGNKRKQTLTSASHTATGAVKIPEVVNVLHTTPSTPEGLVAMVASLLEGLRGSQSLQEQVSLLQTVRSPIRSLLETETQQVLPTLSALLVLYLLPNSIPLSKSLQWVVEIVTRPGKLPLHNARPHVTSSAPPELPSFSQAAAARKFRVSASNWAALRF